MQSAYTSGDFYLTFAKMAGAVPPDATKQTHAGERDQFKTVALGVLYGPEQHDGLARKLGVAPCRGRELLGMHQAAFRRFWKWSDDIEMQGMLGVELRTVFGWTVRVRLAGCQPSRSLRNFPMQANGGAENDARLACCLATERGFWLAASGSRRPVDRGRRRRHRNDAVVSTQAAMREGASGLVLPGFPLRTEVEDRGHAYPDRYLDEPRSTTLGDGFRPALEEEDEEKRKRIPACTHAGIPPAPMPSSRLVFISCHLI